MANDTRDPVSDNQNSLKAGSRGPVLMEDFYFREKMFHFDHERILHAALTATRVAEDDPIAKLREANVFDFSQVRAVILETTGNISVLHGDKLQHRLLDGVHRIE